MPLVTTFSPTVAAPPGAGAAPRSTRVRAAGRVLSGLAVLFLLLDAGMKVLRLPPAIAATAELGFPEGAVRGLGLLQLACLALYLFPRSAVLGAILWTGYLGGAVAAQVRVGAPLATHVLFPVYVAALLWLGLWLRDARLRAVVPLRGGP